MSRFAGTFAIGLFLALSVPVWVSAQEPSSAPVSPNIVLDPATIDRIRKALAAPPSVLDLDDDSGVLRFHSYVVAKWPTFADYLKATNSRLDITPIVPPGGAFAIGGGGGSGMDIVQLVREIYRRHKASQIRDRIDRELQILAERRGSQ